MGLLSFFQREPSNATAPAAPLPPDEVHGARSRARRRLIGAVVLVGIAIVGFPLLFENHPRPIPVDLPIVIANKDKAPPLAMPPARPASTAHGASGALITESASDAGREVAAPASASHASMPDAKPVAKTAATPAAAVVAPTKSASASNDSPPAKMPAAASSDGASRAQAALEGKSAPASKEDGRFVVQVGAFAEASTAREARQRVEKLGLKTYTQTVETAGGSRIRVRVGPFSSRDEADRASAKIKSAGLPAALLTL